MAHALVHILGSRSGYTTLDATAGLTSGDRAELEVLGFGDATSSEAMARLETHACMVGRRLRSGRFAISRMLPGGTDDKGRPTIEVVSLVLDASGYAAVAGAFARLADDVRFWRLARGAVARGYELPEQAPAESAREPGVLRAFDTWVAARKTGSIGVVAAQDAQSLLAMVALLDGQDLGECRWGVGVVSLSAPVDICTLAPATAAIGSRPVLRAATGESWLSPEMAHVEFHVAQNPLLPPRASLVSAVHVEPALDRDAESTPVAAAPRASTSWRPSAPKRNLTMIAAITAAASLAVLVMTTAVYVRTGKVVGMVAATPRAADEADTSVSPLDSERKEPLPASTQTYGVVPEIIPPAQPAPPTISQGASRSGAEAGAETAREGAQPAKAPDRGNQPSDPAPGASGPAQTPTAVEVPAGNPSEGEDLAELREQLVRFKQQKDTIDSNADKLESLRESMKSEQDPVKREDMKGQIKQAEKALLDQMHGMATDALGLLIKFIETDRERAAAAGAYKREQQAGERRATADPEIVRDRNGFIHALIGSSGTTPIGSREWPYVPLARVWSEYLEFVRGLFDGKPSLPFDDIWCARISSQKENLHDAKAQAALGITPKLVVVREPAIVKFAEEFLLDPAKRKPKATQALDRELEKVRGAISEIEDSGGAP